MSMNYIVLFHILKYSICTCRPLSPDKKEAMETGDRSATNYEGGVMSYNSDDDDLNTSSDSDEEK